MAELVLSDLGGSGPMITRGFLNQEYNADQFGEQNDYVEVMSVSVPGGQIAKIKELVITCAASGNFYGRFSVQIKVDDVVIFEELEVGDGGNIINDTAILCFFNSVDIGEYDYLYDMRTGEPGYIDGDVSILVKQTGNIYNDHIASLNVQMVGELVE